MDIYEAALAQGKTDRGELDYVEVPEWLVDGPEGPEPAKVYFYPNLLVGEYIKISEAVDGLTGELRADFDFLCARYTFRNEQGALLWGTSAAYRQMLESLDPVVIKAIVADTGVMERFMYRSAEAEKKRQPQEEE